MPSRRRGPSPYEYRRDFIRSKGFEAILQRVYCEKLEGGGAGKGPAATRFFELIAVIRLRRRRYRHRYRS